MTDSSPSQTGKRPGRISPPLWLARDIVDVLTALTVEASDLPEPITAALSRVQANMLFPDGEVPVSFSDALTLLTAYAKQDPDTRTDIAETVAGRLPGLTDVFDVRETLQRLQYAVTGYGVQHGIRSALQAS